MLVSNRLLVTWVSRLLLVSWAILVSFFCLLTSLSIVRIEIRYTDTTICLEYAIMYAFAPESFPGPLRGTAIGIAATLLRTGGLVATLIKSNVPSASTSVPIYVSAAMWVAVGALCFGLPFETHGHAAI